MFREDKIAAAANPAPEKEWLNFRPPDRPTVQYENTRFDLYFRWRGTAIKSAWPFVLAFAGVTAGIQVAIIRTWNSDCDCHPRWVDEQLGPLAKGVEALTFVVALLLVCFVGMALYKHARTYWVARRIQGAISNIAMAVGSSLDFAKSPQQLKSFAGPLERYLTLAHFFCYRALSPALKHKGWPEMKTICTQKQVLGLVLVEADEWEGLDQAFRFAGSGGVVNTILGWLSMLFDKGAADGLFRDDILKSRMVALNLSFQKNIEYLRDMIDTLNYEEQFPLPLVLVQFVCILVDLVCVFQPAAVVFEVYALVAPGENLSTNSQWGLLATMTAASMVLAYFFQGLMRVCLALSEPLGTAAKRNSPSRMENEENFIEVRTFLNQTRSSTYSHLNVGRFLPENLQ